jgi:site-specific recombinase XerD
MRRDASRTGRHATVSHLIRAGLDAKAVQTYAGHSSITTTCDVYGHLFPSTVDADRERLDDYFRAMRVPYSEPETTGQDG